MGDRGPAGPVDIWAVLDFIETATAQDLVWIHNMWRCSVDDVVARHAAVPGWDPWAALLGRPGIVFELRGLPDDVHGLAEWWEGVPGGRIILDPRPRTTAERSETLTHELVHLERAAAGRCPPWPWSAQDRAAEEAKVRRATARRMRRWVGRAGVAAGVRAAGEPGPLVDGGLALGGCA